MTANIENDFKTIIKSEFIARCRRNPRYSLRSFARSLSVSPASLSGMLNGRRAITNRSVEKIGRALGLSPAEIKVLKQQKTFQSDNQHFAQLALDTFAYVSDWYHDAILELMKVDGFQFQPKWIAGRLSITEDEVTTAVDRLIRLHILVRQADGSWHDLSNGFSTSLYPGITSEGARRLQKQLGIKSVDAIDAIPLEERDHTSMMMAIDPKDLPQARALIKQCRRNLSDLLERAGASKKEVYQLTVGLFPVTKKEIKNQTGIKSHKGKKI